MRRFLRVVVRFVVVAVIEALSLLVMDWLIPGITLVSSHSADILPVAMSAALVLGVMNGLVRPFLVLLTLPLNILTLGFSTLIINAAMLLLTSHFLPYFVVNGWGAALWGTLILAAVNTFLTSLTTIDDDYSFFDGVVQWLSKRQQVSSVTEPGRGLVMLEIDGLSYLRIQRAVEQGLMPTVREMLHDGTHALARYDCGLPSQTSSCQAGIMYGDNFDIPAFRWYDKDRGRLIVSNHFDDAAEINARYARGHGLLRGGSSINNLMTGDAKKTVLTMSVLRDRPEDMERRSLEDLYLFWLNPYVLTRSIVLTLWDILVELGQGVRQRVLNIRPRVNRLHKAYPFLRAVTNVFLRDLGTFIVMMDVIRGMPAIYATYVGYDEIAHRAGPDTPDAMNSLRGLDTQLRRILDVVRRKAPRLYDVILLSDHGQSVGATFKQRYGQTLTAFIEELVEDKATVAEVNASENRQGYTTALLAEIQGMEQRVGGGRIRRATLGQARKALQGRLERAAPPAVMDAQVVVCASGNLAHVYFDLHAGKVSVRELSEVHPGLVDALVAHPGVGFVVAYAEDGAPWVLGKDGARNLQTGTVIESDPLVPYGDPDHRAAQLLYLAQFPHAGDLVVDSALYPDGQVAAFEELVGSHGGLGGQQTDAFLLHPADMVVPPTSNASDVFALLDARRGLPGEPLRPRPLAGKGVGTAPPSPKPPRHRISWRAAILLMAAVVLLTVTAVTLTVWGQPLIAFFRDTAEVAAFMRRWGRWAPIVTVGLHVAQVVVAPVPGQALDAVNGLLFGPWLGTLLSMIGLGIGSALAMGLARRFGRPLVERFVDRRALTRLDGFLQQHGALFIFLIFLFPFLPDDAVCFLAGLTPIPLVELVLLAVIGRLPGIFVANWVGANAVGLSPVQWGVLGAILLALGVVFWRLQEHIEGALLNLIDRIAGWWERWRSNASDQ